jgi:hypothetical protein
MDRGQICGQIADGFSSDGNDDRRARHIGDRVQRLARGLQGGGVSLPGPVTAGRYAIEQLF